MYIYLSNDNPDPMEVFFDDFKVVHVQSETVQADDYYPFGLTFNHYRDTTGQKNKYLYQGKELLAGTGLYDLHARGYNAALGRFMQVDPKYNGPSGYIGMLNNPLGNVDPDGEEAVSLVTALIIGVAVSAVSYTAAIAFSDGGFDNWDWGDFGKSVTIGAVSSVITFGVGEIFQGWVTVNSAQEALKVVASAATHATVQGTIATMDGGDFGSSFLSGFAGGLVGSAATALKWGGVGTVSSAMLMGGVSSELSGGEFWRGAAVGGIVAGANHVAHKVGASAEERVQQRRQQKQAAQNGGRAPYQNSHGERIYTMEEFITANSGLNRSEIINQREDRSWLLGSQPGGPNMRYVRNPHDGKVIDMRHMLVVGKYPAAIGSILLTSGLMGKRVGWIDKTFILIA